MVVITDDERIDGLQFREQKDEQAKAMYGPESGPCIRQDQNSFQLHPEIRLRFRPFFDFRQRCFYATLRFSAELQSMPCCELKQGENY